MNYSYRTLRPGAKVGYVSVESSTHIFLIQTIFRTTNLFLLKNMLVYLFGLIGNIYHKIEYPKSKCTSQTGILIATLSVQRNNFAVAYMAKQRRLLFSSKFNFYIEFKK